MVANQEGRRAELIRLTMDDAKKWVELRDALRVPEATLGRDLKQLQSDGIINKKYNDKGKTVYQVNKSGFEDSKWVEKLESLKETRENILDKLEEEGLFEEGMELDEFGVFLEDNREELEEFPIDLPEGEDISDAELMQTKAHLLKFLFPKDIEIESNTKVIR